MATTLRVKLLGRPAFEAGGEAVACASKKGVALAAYIFYTRSTHSRTRLASLFWGGGSPRHAAGSLRVALTKLPRVLLEALAVDRDSIGIAPGTAVAIDIEELTHGITAPDVLAQAEALGR